MSMLEMIVGSGLRSMTDAIMPEFEIAQDHIAERGETDWQKNILRVKGGPQNKIAFLSGAYYFGVRLGHVIMFGDERQRDVFDIQSYADLIERGIKGTTYTARPVAKITTEGLEPTVERELDRAGRRVEKKF